MTLIVLTYLIGLPISVWMLANLCALIDEPRRIVALLRLVTSICLLLGILLLTNKALLIPLMYAFITVVLLHMLSFWGLRRFAIGVPVYQPSPPPTPLLSEQAPDNADEQNNVNAPEEG